MENRKLDKIGPINESTYKQHKLTLKFPNSIHEFTFASISLHQSMASPSNVVPK